MRLTELTDKILDIPFKNSLLRVFQRRLTPQVYMDAFVNTSVMVGHSHVAPHRNKPQGHGLS
ncbi:MAG: hypothetical protein PVH61_33825 [Candidatus Aminicenantes bacterium]|jgi:hypothetical protein